MAPSSRAVQTGTRCYTGPKANLTGQGPYGLFRSHIGSIMMTGCARAHYHISIASRGRQALHTSPLEGTSVILFVLLFAWQLVGYSGAVDERSQHHERSSKGSSGEIISIDSVHDLVDPCTWPLIMAAGS